MIFTSLYEYNRFSWCLLGILSKTVLIDEVGSVYFEVRFVFTGFCYCVVCMGCQGHLNELKRRDFYYCELYQIT